LQTTYSHPEHHFLMAVKSKTALGRVEHRLGKPKKTRQGAGKNSKASHGRKKYRGQGK
jgi:hypothetical protein